MLQKITYRNESWSIVYPCLYHDILKLFNCDISQKLNERYVTIYYYPTPNILLK